MVAIALAYFDKVRGRIFFPQPAVSLCDGLPNQDSASVSKKSSSSVRASAVGDK